MFENYIVTIFAVVRNYLFKVDKYSTDGHVFKKLSSFNKLKELIFSNNRTRKIKKKMQRIH